MRHVLGLLLTGTTIALAVTGGLALPEANALGTGDQPADRPTITAAGGGSPTAALAARGTDPVSVLQATFDAQNAGDVEAGLTVFADDAVIVNTRGFKMSGKEEIRRFIQANINGHVQAHVDRGSLQIRGDTVTLSDKYTTAFFKQWGVAGYVNFKTDIVVREGRIKSMINYITLDGLLAIQRACDSLQARGASDLWTACTNFLTLARIQTHSVLGAEAQPSWCLVWRECDY